MPAFDQTKGIADDSIENDWTQDFKGCAPGGSKHAAENFLLDQARGVLREISSAEGKRSAGESVGQKDMGVFHPG